MGKMRRGGSVFTAFENVRGQTMNKFAKWYKYGRITLRLNLYGNSTFVYCILLATKSVFQCEL